MAFKFDQSSVGLHQGYRDPASGDVIYRINTDGGNAVQYILFSDGTKQVTAAGAGTTVTTLTISGGVNVSSSGNVLVLATGGAGGITVTLPTAVGAAGQSACIKKTDSGVGAVTVATTGGQTIDGASTYLLVNQYQYVTVQSDGSNWWIVAQN